MKKTFTFFIVLFFTFLLSTNVAFSQGNTCATATPFCTTIQDPGFTWPNTNNGSTSQSGPSYGCLGGMPDPSWFYLETTAAGAMTFTLSQVDGTGTGIDVDFVAWGPFTAAQFATACSNLTGACSGGASNTTPNPGCSGGIVDCSYSTSATENMTINSPGPNMFYIIMITNYAQVSGYITLSQTGGPYTNCAVTCPTSLPLAADDNTSHAAIANGSTLACTQGLFWIYANEPNNGSVGNVYTDIFTPCIDVDFKYYSANLGADETVNLYENGTYVNCIGPGVGCAFPVGGGNTAVGNYWDLLWNYLDPTKSHDFAFCHAGAVTTTTVTIEDCWKNTPIVPSFTIGTASAACFTVNVPANTGIGVASFSISPVSGAASITDYHDGYVLINPATLAAGTYTVTYTFVGTNCPAANGTFVFTVPVKPVVSITSTNPVTICNGQSTVLSANAVGGTITSYSWSPSTGLSGTTASSVTANPTTTTVYSVTATNSAGCAAATPATVTVNVTPLPTLTVTPSPATLCSGASSILTASGGTTYTWSANAGSVTTSTASVTPPTGTTIYTVTGTNSGCSNTNTVSITVTATPTVNISGTLSICSGTSTTLTGATANSYSWSVGSTSSSISVSPTSNTTYTLTGTNGTCTASAVATVTVTPTPTLTISGTTALCSGQSTTLTGATATNYTWSTGPNTNTISVTPPTGTTNYTLTGANGTCVSTKTVAVVVTATPTLTISGTTAICSGQSTVLTGATATNYTWSTGPNTNTISVTPPTGTTNYTLTGANGTCVSTKTVAVVVTATPTLNISGTTALCSGQSTVLTGATATNYTWSTGPNTNTISVTPPAGTTTYTLTGANGACTASTTASVVVTATPTLTISGTTAICSGQSTTLTGATATNYTWSTGPNTNTISVTPPTGTTNYTLTGANGTCVSTKTVAVVVTATPTLTISGTTALCSGQSTTLTGATATNYTWSTGPNTNTITVTPPAGTNNYTLTGANGTCVSTKTVAVVVTATPTLTISGTTAICSGQSTVLTGATATNYTWSTGSTVSTTTVSPGTGSTTYTLTGANGACTATTAATVSVTATPTVSIGGITAICNGQSIVLTGATATSYSWSSGGITSNTITVNPTSNTTYTLIGTNGTCTASAVGTVTVNPLPVIGTASVTAAPCGLSTGCINSVSVSGGTPSYQYSWDNGTTWSASSTNCNVPAGTYPLQVQDVFGCLATSNISVPSQNGPSAPTAAATATASCSGDNAVFTVNPTSVGITYTWTDITGTHTGSTYSVTNINPPGAYNVAVTASDAFGCTSTATTLSITVNPLPPTTVSGTTHFCKGFSTVLNASPNTAGYGYQWSQNGTPIVGATSYSYTANAAGNYNVSITDLGTGCKAALAGSYTVTVDSLPKIDTTSMVITPSNCTSATGAITSVTVNPSAGNTYSWTDANGNVVGTSLNLGTVPAGNYCLHVTTNPDACKDSICAITLNNSGAPNPPVITSAGNNTYCAGQTQNPIVVTGSVTINWYSDAGLTTQIATGTTYTPNVTTTTTVYATATNNGCQSAALPIVITINPNPTPPILSGTATNPLNECQGSTAQSVSVATTGTVTSLPVWYNGATYVTTGTSYTPSTAIPGTTVYTIVDSATVTGCKDMTAGNVLTVTVTINPTPTAPTLAGSATNPLVQCQNAPAQGILVATTGTVTSIPVWYNGSTYVTSGTTYTPSTSTPGTTVYTIIDSATVAGSCLSSAAGNVLTVTVTINPSPTAPTLGGSASNPLVECQGSSAQSVSVNTTGSVPSIPVWYSNGVYVATGTSYTPSTATPGTTVYTIADSASVTGCKDTSASNVLTVTVTINPTPTAPTLAGSATNPLTQCQGATAQTLSVAISGTVPSVPVWYNGSTYVTTGTSYTPSTATPGTTVYTVLDSATVAGGCSSSVTGSVLTITVTINPTPTGPTLAGSAPNPLVECSGTTPQTITVATSGSVPSIPVWYNGSTYVGSGTSYTPNTTTPGTTVYTVIDSATVGGCKDLSAANVLTVTVTVNPNPTITGTPLIDSSKCGSNNGHILGLSANGGTPAYSYQWVDANGTVVGTTDSLTNVGPGTYSLIVTDANNCKDTSNTGLAVFGTSTINAAFTPSLNGGQAPLAVVFTNTSTGASNYNWSLGDNNTSTAVNPAYTYTNSGTYTITLIATNGNCIDTAFTVITIDVATSIVIPNIFSPNGDGLNDEFIITCTGMKTLNCDIFNRWGQLVYTLTAPNQNWDGKLNNGNMATEGTYYFMLNAVGVDKKTYTYQGPITLVK